MRVRNVMLVDRFVMAKGNVCSPRSKMAKQCAQATADMGGPQMNAVEYCIG